ncbi:DNA topoisomerase, type IA, core [Artemisia annua]|uniref:DNA topoisomerase, type IA, core n=1 Tax=Artemisia annua TaxID=35608 RepID=A0A2U1P5L3_ARTAN|nr:DNA topoisomerase, type IA, core [Artemisia annua]
MSLSALVPDFKDREPRSHTEAIRVSCDVVSYLRHKDEHKKGHLPKRASVSQGKHLDKGQPVVLKLARHTQAPVPKNTNPSDVTLERALKFLTGKDAEQTGRPKNRDKEVVESLRAIRRRESS